MPTRYHVGTSTPASDNAAGIMASLATLFAVTTDVDTGAAVHYSASAIVRVALGRDPGGGVRGLRQRLFS